MGYPPQWIENILAHPRLDELYPSPSMRSPSFSGLSVKIALPFLLFVALGSTALVFWLQLAAEHESERVFVALADTNARFIRSARLPLNERVAEPLGRVLNMNMFFRHAGEGLVPSPAEPLATRYGARLKQLRPEDDVLRLDSRMEAIAAPVKPGVDLLLARPRERRLAFLSRRSTLVALGSFWALSLALAFSVSRGLVRPLRLLASRLPLIEHDTEPALPGTERQDELGQLARAYVETRNQLAEERGRRREAERLALLGRMATGLAHEIHNPLSAIKLHAQMLHSNALEAPQEDQAEALGLILQESARIESLVNQWMFLARPAPPRISRMRLDELVAKTAASHQARAEHAGVRIVQEFTSEIWIDADARRIAQAVANILLNAIQAMPDGGELRIRGGPDNTVTFSDTGCGFSEEALRRCADLFFSEKEGGMGIGLSVSSEILKTHGGRLRVANNPAGGAIVTIELPLV